MDLNSIIEQDSTEIELRHPQTDDGLGIFMSIAGPEHDSRRAATFAAQRRTRRQLAKAKGNDVWKMLAEADPEDEEEHMTDFLVACTLGWRNLDIDGRPLEFNAANARKLYTDPKRAWVRRQVRAALDDANLFIATSARD